MTLIDSLVGTKQGGEDYIVFTPMAFEPEKKSLEVRIDHIGDARWLAYTTFKEGETYIFRRHGNSDNTINTSVDPMELWEWHRPGQKEDETILPQVLLYFWHKDNRLSMELDW
jgi:hypothetical protein